MHWQQVDCGQSKFYSIMNGWRATERRVRTTQPLRNFLPEFAKAFHMHFVNHGIVQWDPGSRVPLPIESGVDDHRLRHTPRIVTEVLRQILFLVADHVTEYFICP